MRVYFLRHGKADWPNWDRPDDERPLTEKGKKQMKRIAAAFERFKIQPAVILSSPLPRAFQTAEFAAEALGLQVSAEAALAPGFNADDLRALLQKHANDDVMLVGHEPDFSNAVEALTGAVIVMKKAGIACVEVYDTRELDGELLWLVTPKFLEDRP